MTKCLSVMCSLLLLITKEKGNQALLEVDFIKAEGEIKLSYQTKGGN
jgi:hypothetical protein